MRRAGISLLAVATGSGAFAWWGVYTVAGQRRFDEMDGMYPFFAGVAAAVLLVVGAALLGLSLRGRSKA